MVGQEGVDDGGDGSRVIDNSGPRVNARNDAVRPLGTVGGTSSASF